MTNRDVNEDTKKYGNNRNTYEIHTWSLLFKFDISNVPLCLILFMLWTREELLYYTLTKFCDDFSNTAIDFNYNIFTVNIIKLNGSI